MIKLKREDLPMDYWIEIGEKLGLDKPEEVTEYCLKLADLKREPLDPKRKCSNCKHRAWSSWSGTDLCMGYEMATTTREEMIEAINCPKFEEGTPECFMDDDYCPSATNGDYSPSNPWDAPGMSVRDFI